MRSVSSPLAVPFGWARQPALPYRYSSLLVGRPSGPLFHFSDSWQLVINTGTTIVTFLMVFLIQATQNRDAQAIHLKLDELIRSNRDARNAIAGIEDCTEEELQHLRSEFQRLRQKDRTTPAR